MNEEKDNRREIKSKKYLLVFLLTLAIFITGIIISKQFGSKRINNIKEVEDNMYIDILSSEVQFSLLEDAGCKGLTEKTVLSSELRDLADKISFMERDLKDGSEDFFALKKKYQLLEIKDYLLMKKLSKKCFLQPINILYFYSNKDERVAEESKKQLYVLEKLEKDNPRLRVYYFDYDIPFSVVRTLIISKKVGEKMPALVINNKVYNGFQSIEKIQKLLPKLEIKEEAKFNLNNSETCLKAVSQCNACTRKNVKDKFECTEFVCEKEEFTCEKEVVEEEKKEEGKKEEKKK